MNQKIKMIKTITLKNRKVLLRINQSQNTKTMSPKPQKMTPLIKTTQRLRRTIKPLTTNQSTSPSLMTMMSLNISPKQTMRTKMRISPKIQNPESQSNLRTNLSILQTLIKTPLKLSMISLIQSSTDLKVTDLLSITSIL